MADTNNSGWGSIGNTLSNVFGGADLNNAPNMFGVNNNTGIIPNISGISGNITGGAAPTQSLAAPAYTPIATPQSNFTSVGSDYTTGLNLTPVGANTSPQTPNTNFSSIGGGVSGGNTSIANLIAQADAPNTAFSSVGATDATAGNWFSNSNANPTNWTTEGIGQGLGVAKGLFDVYSGWQAMQLGQDQFNFQKESWQADYDQRKESYDYEIARREGRDRAASGEAT